MTSPLVVVGGGICGLGVAWRAMEAGRDVVVLEASDRVGGAIRSESVDGLLIERGPQSLLSSAPETLRMILAMGLRGRVIEAEKAARKRFILWDGRLVAVPRGLLDGGFVPRAALLRAMAEPFIGRRSPPDPEESIAEFATRRFGATIAERLVDPFVAGVYAGDPSRLEIAATFPDLARWEAESGSVMLGALRGGRRKRHPEAPKTLYTLEGGVEALPRAISAALGDRVRLAAPVRAIERVGSGFRVRSSAGDLDAAEVAVCVPPAQAGFAAVPGMPTATLAAVHLAFRPGDVPAVDGFGWLAPSSQRQDVLGCLWVSSAFPSHAPGRVLVRVMLGGARDPRLPDDDGLITRARAVLGEVQGIDAEPVLTHVARASVPQYDRGHLAAVAALQQPGMRFLGWGYTGTGVEKCLAAS
jgi:oxygen-dependent protoporphyrinogen oxidase